MNQFPKKKIKLNKKQVISFILTLLLILAVSYFGLNKDEAATDGQEAPALSSTHEATLPQETLPEETSPQTTTPEVTSAPTTPAPTTPQPTEPKLDKKGYYYSKDDVALYIHTYGCLPDNFITKDEARDLGWNGGSLERYAPGMAIGGDRFGNYEGLLPTKKGRKYTECDIDTKGKSSRGAKRIVFSNDGLIYYTDDHYESFTLLYGEE